MRSSALILAACVPMTVGCAEDPIEAGIDASARDCRPESRRCLEGRSQLCTADGLWSVPQPCGRAFVCVDGVCSVDCPDGCSVGTARCTPEGVQECVATDGCGRWSPPRPCPDGRRCGGGRCTDACDPCPVGERRCAGDGFTECLAGACPRWSEPEVCGAGTGCSGGACVADGACEDGCQEGMATCADDRTEQVCARQASGCLDWSAPVECPPDARCEPGAGCDDGCGPARCEDGAARCIDGGVQRCTRDARGCAVWGAIEDCGTPCVDGVCEPQCERECEPGTRQCAPGGVQTCEADGECSAWGAAAPCDDGLSCAGAGACRACDPGEEEVRPCARCGMERRRCDDGGAWSAWGGCEGQGACEPGASEPCGRCGTRRCDDRCAWGACEGAGACEPGARQDCGQCGFQVCTAACAWEACGNGDGTTWRRCNECGWQFCCPTGDWCPCAGRFPESCNGAECRADGVCI